MAQVRVSEAVQLFVERAAAARPSFVLTDQNGPAVARICQRLDGIALAIELAAVRTRGLPLEHIAAGLDDRFELLSGPSRGTVPRHVTLRALVDWSHELLSEPERGLFRRLAVFSGGWTVEAAVAVCGGEPADDVLRVLGALVEKSLVLLEDHDGQARYGFLETIRQYAAEKLRQSGELPALQRAHAEWFVRQTHAVHRDAAGPQVDIGFGRLAAEQDNLRAALDWCKAEDVVLGLELGGELMHFWYRFGYLTEGREHLAQLLAAPAGAAANQHPAPRREAATAAALLAAGRLAMRQGSREARDLLDRSLALARELNKPRLLASCLSYRGRLAYWQNELSEAKPLLEQALAVARAAGARQTILHALHGLGLAHQALGELATARAFYDEELALARVTEDPWTITIALHQRAMLAIDEEELTFAKKLLKEAIAVWRRSSDRVLSVRLLEGMAHVALLEGQPERAVRLSGAASLLGETFGDTGSETLRASFVERLAVVRNGLGAAASKAWQAGRTLTIEDALEEALADGERRPTPGGLTRRECEVARLLARGLSNREIGEALVVTEGTAKTHVEHILTKLGMSSRAEVAAWAAQHSLVEDAVGA